MSEEQDNPINTAEGSEVLNQFKKFMISPSSGGLGFKDVLGFTDQEMDSTYVTACQQLQANNAKSASKLFALLCATKHNESKYWRGLGLCMHRMKIWVAAEMMYTTALRWDPNDFITRQFYAETLLKLNKPTKAQVECDRAIELGRANVKPDTMQFLKRAEKFRAFLTQSQVVVDN